MKYLAPIFLLMVILCSCSKKQSAPLIATPPSQPSKLDTISIAAAPISMQKYLGCLVANVWYGGGCDAPGPEYDSDAASVYDMINIKDSLLVLRAEKQLYLAGLQETITLFDTLPIQIRDNTPCIKDSARGYFKIANDSIYVNTGLGAERLSYQAGILLRFTGKALYDTAVLVPIHL